MLQQLGRRDPIRQALFTAAAALTVLVTSGCSGGAIEIREQNSILFATLDNESSAQPDALFSGELRVRESDGCVVALSRSATYAVVFPAGTRAISASELELPDGQTARIGSTVDLAGGSFARKSMGVTFADERCSAEQVIIVNR